MGGGVVSFLDQPDEFYEGKYNNRTRYAPRSHGLLATLPLRIVQGYTTSVADALPPGATVVEIGCAAGIDWFARRYRMIGMDLSRAALASVAERYALAVQCNATAMPLASGSVDGVVSSCLFEHLSAQDKARLLAECQRVLKPGGKVVFHYDIRTDNPVIARYRRNRPDLYQRLFLDGDGHIGYAGIEDNRALFTTAGLAIAREAFHERTPLLSNSVWQKLSHWPGTAGRIGRIGARFTSGPAMLPSLGLIWLADATIGRLLPRRHARMMTTVAVKP